MSKKVRGYPHKQPFCVTPHPNKYKKNSWWSPASATYWVLKKAATKKDIKEVVGVPILDPVMEEVTAQ